MSTAKKLLDRLNESHYKFDPKSGEDRAKLLKAAEDLKIKVVSERDKDGYVVVDLSSKDSAALASFKSHANKLNCKFVN